MSLIAQLSLDAAVNNYIRWMDGQVEFFNDNLKVDIEDIQTKVDGNEGYAEPEDVFSKDFSGKNVHYQCTLRPAVYRRCALKGVNVIGEVYDKEQVQ